MAIDTLRILGSGPPIFRFSDNPQTQSGHTIDTLQRKTKGFSDLPEGVDGGSCKEAKQPQYHSYCRRNDKKRNNINFSRFRTYKSIITPQKNIVNPPGQNLKKLNKPNGHLEENVNCAPLTKIKR